MKTIGSGLAVAFVLISALAFGEDGGAAATGRQILREEGCWDIATTTGFYQRPSGVTQVPFKDLAAVGSRGGMLGIGELTEGYAVRNSIGWAFKEVPPGQTLFRLIFQGPELIQRQLWEFDATFQAAADPRLKVAFRPSDLEQARRENRVAVVLGLDTGAEINDDLATLRLYHRLGLRKLALVHAVGTSWADSVTSKPAGEPGGLSDFGRQVVRECNRLGIMVDLAHASDKTFWDTLAVSTRPLLASHTGARAVADLSRNMSDAMLRALAAKGGLVGVCGLFDTAEAQKADAGAYSSNYVATSLYLGVKYPDHYQFAAAIKNPAEQAEARRQLGLETTREYRFLKLENPEKIPAIARILLDHLDHIVKVIGVDHVGIGTDLNLARPGYPELISALATGLVERGYTREQMRKILWQNYANYFSAVIAGTPSAESQ